MFRHLASTRNCRLSPAANKSATCLRLPPACVRHTSAGLQHTKPSAESGGLLHYRQRRSLCSWLRMAFIRLKTDTSPNLGTDTGLTISRKAVLLSVSRYRRCGLVASKERVFLIGDMFPIDERYIKAPYRISAYHYVSKNKALNTTLRRKAMKYLRLVERGVTYSRNDIMGIKQKLISDRVAATK